MEGLKLNHKILNIKINKIKPNAYNPNVMEDKTFEQTKKNIKKEGLIGSIFCRENPKKKGNYIIVDGEHRWRVAKDLGYEEISVIVLDKSLPDAMIATINFNKLRGEIDTLKLAGVINELRKTYGVEELEDRLGYSSEDLSNLENLLEFDPSQFKGEGIELGEEREEYRFEVTLTEKQNNILQNALKSVGKEGEADKITVMCSNYVKKNEKNNK